MRRWEFAISLEPSANRPLFAQISQAIVAAIRKGRLGPRDRLPGSRQLAQSLGVHRNTVVAAYNELHAEGWITTSLARGTFVSADLPEPKPRSFANLHRTAMPDRLGFDLAKAPKLAVADRMQESSRTLSMAGGTPDIRLVPALEMARAYRRVVRGKSKAPLGYGDAYGALSLRKAIAEMLTTTRGLAASPESVLVTRGSQMAIYLVARLLVTEGDVVAVEHPGFPRAWDAFQLAGARVVPVSVDDAGISVTELKLIAERHNLLKAGSQTSSRLRAIYVTPHHQYPTTVTLSAPRRLELLEFARTHRIAIIEDDFDHEFHYEGRPILPLASADSAGVVIYVGTLSKVLAPALRIAYLAAPEILLERAASYRSRIDLQGDHVTECAIADLFENGDIQRHVRRMRRIYKDRRDVLVNELESQLKNALSFRVPNGGTAVWATVNDGIDVDDWTARAARRGVLVHSSARFQLDHRATSHLRLGFAPLRKSEIKEAVSRLSRALRKR